ncbi:molybdopterin-dependent oxidoreductase [Streptomyces sp. NPDC005227]|uniref:molybdopterin-dependent oxidoreductase n=1 Tax=unclassified Streptomyces TaxID=2593676 RepID=UPI0036A6EF36
MRTNSADAPGRGHGEDRPVGRRIILGALGLGALGVAVGAPAQRRLDGTLAGIASKDPTGLVSLLPGGGGFRFYSVADKVPHLSTDDYRLTVDGLVDRPASYRLDELTAMPSTRLVRDVQCVTGWRVPQTAFTGVRLSHLLDLAGVRSNAAAVTFTCFDGIYTESLTLEQARRHDMLVSYKMRDESLSAAHGGPVRLYAAPMYFYKSAKWLSGITVTDRVQPGYWERRGYEVDGWVGKSNGRDDDPTS